MTLTLYVPHPERWWVARRADLPRLTDPHKADQRVRHPDRDERSWREIARVVAAVGRAIAHGGNRVDEDDPTVAVVEVESSGLEPSDRRIVASWFQTGSAPSSDPWKNSLSNGRHRLWAAWRAAPDALLPIYSAALADLDNVSEMGAGFAATVRQSAFDGLCRLPQGPANSSPRYVDELRRVASEGGHDVAGLPRLTPVERTSWWSRLAGR